MNITMLKRVRNSFNSPYVGADINRANQRKWVVSVRHLGDKWKCHPAQYVNADQGAKHGSEYSRSPD